MKAVRMFFGLSVNDVATRSSIPESDMVSYEKQTEEPDVETLQRFCDLFGMAIEDLFYVELEEGEASDISEVMEVSEMGGDYSADQGEPEY